MSLSATQKTKNALKEVSKIIKFYRNRSIFITGGTGFVGKVLIEKLLRTCTSIATIFVLIRSKRNKQPQDRLREILACRLFDRIRQENEELLNKVVAVEGDVEKANLNLSDVELARIEQQVSVVYHVAATVRFNEQLRKAVSINLIGTKNVVELCRRISKLSALVHVSTAYANYELENVDERIYPVDMKPDKLIKLSKLLDDHQMEALKPRIMNNLPNTYVSTKKQAEWLLLSTASDLPVVICRPAIVSATWREPFPGWIDNANAGTAVFLNQGLGYLQTMFGKTECLSDLVPVDKVVAMIISLGWYASLRIESRSDKVHIITSITTAPNSDDEYYPTTTPTVGSISRSNVADATVFHCTSGQVNPITWNRALHLSLKYWLKYPSVSTYQYPTIPFTRYSLLNKFYRASLQTLPAHLMDLMARLLNEKTNLAHRIMRLNQLVQVLEPFASRSWNFKTNNDSRLINKLMTEEDKRLFGCDLVDLDWEEYFENYVLGMREFVLKESWQALEQGRRRMRKVYFRSRLFVVLTGFLMAFLTYVFLVTLLRRI